MPDKQHKLTLKTLFTVLGLVLLNPMSHAQDISDVNQLKALVDAKQFQQAYELSSRLLEDWGGDPGFDLLAGQAAYGAGHFQEAVFSFERVLLVNPDVLQARLYLAFSYFQVKNLGAAQTELTKLLQEELKPEDAAQVREYLDQITELKEAAVVDHAFNVRLAYGYDSNANSGATSDNLIGISPDAPYAPIAQFLVLDENSLEQSDSVSEVQLNYAYSEKLSQKRTLNFSASYINTTHDEQTRFDREILTLTGVYNDEWYGSNINIATYVQPMILDGEFYRAAYGMSFDSSYRIADKWQWLWGLTYNSINVNANDNLDLGQFSYRTRFTHTDSALQMVELGYSEDDSRENNDAAISNAKDFWYLRYTYARPVGERWVIIVNGAYQDIKHDGASPAIGVVREEENWAALFSLDYLVNPDWKLTGTVSYTDKISNVEIYEYDRTTAIFSVTRNF